MAYFTKCGEQGMVSTVSRKLRLTNHKSHIKQSKIVKHFTEKCNDPIASVRHLGFVHWIPVKGWYWGKKKKEKFWCGTLVTQH